jgi:hypothetical protein
MKMPATSQDHDPLNDLSDPLRAAVESIRREPISPAALRRAADPARRLARPGVPMRLPRLLLVAGAMAASFLLGVALRQATPPVAAYLAGEGPRREPVVAAPLQTITPKGDLHAVSVSRLGSSWGDWERMRLPSSGFLAARRLAHPPRYPRITGGDHLAQLSAEAVIEENRARTTVQLTFHPATTRTEPWVEYPLPPGASIVSVGLLCGATSPLGQPDPNPNVLCGPLGSLPAGLPPGLRITYDQELSDRDGRLIYSFPLPDCLIEKFSFKLTAEPTPGADFLPRDADFHEGDSLVEYRVRRAWTQPSGSISYLVPKRP